MTRFDWVTLGCIAASKTSILSQILTKGPQVVLASIQEPDFTKARKQAEIELSRTDITIITQEDDTYPKSLLNIDSPPACLFIHGEIPIGHAIAIVGTRKATPGGLGIARVLASDIARAGFVIVSGMADGIDSAAHLGAIDGNGKTIAVLGSGLGENKSSQKQMMRDKIKQNGAIITEFPWDFYGATWNFPWRNRIIAALSDATLVIEAPESSGALITARFASDLGKPVMACPGLPGMSSFTGCNKLIKDGAILVDSLEDVLDVFGVKPHAIEASVSEYESIILNLISEPANLDIVCEKSGMPAEAVMSILTVLDLKGLVKRLPGGLYLKSSFSNTKGRKDKR